MSNNFKKNEPANISKIIYTCRKCRAKHNVYNPEGEVDKLKCERCFAKYFTRDLDNGKIELGITPEEMRRIWCEK